MVNPVNSNSELCSIVLWSETSIESSILIFQVGNHLVNPGSQGVNLFHSGFFLSFFNTQYGKHESRIIV